MIKAAESLPATVKSTFARRELGCKSISLKVEREVDRIIKKVESPNSPALQEVYNAIQEYASDRISFR